MSVLRMLFKKLSAAGKRAPASERSACADRLSELRHRVRTGDPKLNKSHHSGSFGAEKE